MKSGGNDFSKFHRGGHKLPIFHWGLGSIASGLLFSLNFSGVHPDEPRCTPVHPGRGSEVGCISFPNELGIFKILVSLSTCILTSTHTEKTNAGARIAQTRIIINNKGPRPGTYMSKRISFSFLKNE